jgi:hypothetical protein
MKIELLWLFINQRSWILLSRWHCVWRCARDLQTEGAERIHRFPTPRGRIAHICALLFQVNAKLVVLLHIREKIVLLLWNLTNALAVSFLCAARCRAWDTNLLPRFNCGTAINLGCAGTRFDGGRNSCDNRWWRVSDLIRKIHKQ